MLKILIILISKLCYRLYSKNKVDDFGNPKLYLAVDDGSWKKNNTNPQQTQQSAPQQRDEFEDDIPF